MSSQFLSECVILSCSRCRIYFPSLVSGRATLFCSHSRIYFFHRGPVLKPLPGLQNRTRSAPSGEFLGDLRHDARKWARMISQCWRRRSELADWHVDVCKKRNPPKLALPKDFFGFWQLSKPVGQWVGQCYF